MKIKPVFLLFLIICLSIFLRLYKLGEVPISPDWDEAALGYNAYSILKTGKDEYDIFLPRSLRSYDDYKPPLYVYLTVPSVAMFGLNLWSTRLPSAIMGVLGVLGTYFLVWELFRKRDIALLSAFLLAISPWHLQFSRIAFEANTGITLNIWTIYALLKAKLNARFLILCAFLSGLSLYAYHSERIFIPLLLLTGVIIWKNELFRQKKNVAAAVIVGFITILPLVPVVFDNTSITRLKGTSSLADQTGLLYRSVGKIQDDLASGTRLGAIFDNRRIVYAQKLLEGYISHYSIKWLFFTGDNERHHAPDMGLLYLWEFPFILFGIFNLWKKGSKQIKFLLVWFLLAPIAASPTSETPHAIRTLVFLPTFQIFAAFGIIEFFYNKPLKIINAAILLFATANIFYYFHMYYGHMNYEYSRFWQYGYKQAVEYTEKNKSKYNKIVVSTKLEQPHMFYLFYTKYDPVQYLREGGTSSGGFAEVRNKFDKYEFRTINWPLELHDGSVLYIGTPNDIGVRPIVSIPYLNNEEAIRIAE